MPSFPPTVIVRHAKENPRKCTVLPLLGQEGILLLDYPLKKPRDFAGYVRLAAEGPELSELDAGQGLLLLDGSWRWVAAMTRDFSHVAPRSLHGYLTAYPRVSKRGTDPAHGLASVEALYIALHILGRPANGVLANYHWRDEFIRLNAHLR